MQKISLFYLLILDIQPLLESHDQTGRSHCLQRPPKNFSSTFNCRKFVLPCKNKTISSICSEDMVDQKILEFVCLRVFWAISQEQEFSHVWDLCRNTNNNLNSHYRPNSVKINDQIFQ